MAQTLPENSPPRKPSRFGLYAPFLALIAAVSVWTIVWTWMAGEVGRRLDAAAGALGPSGYQLNWGRRTVSGYPFRLDLDLKSPSLKEASGWGLTAPELKAEAFAFAPDDWVIVAPAGVTLVRRVGGPVIVRGKALRASLTHRDAYPASLSVEGLDLTFAPGEGATPVALTDAASLQFDTRAMPGDQGAVYLEIGKARAAPGGLLADIAGAAPVTLTLDAAWSHAHALTGDGFAGALKAWSGAGGQLTIRRLGLDAGPASLDARAGTLSPDADGRLAGSLDLSASDGPRLLDLLVARGKVPADAARAAKVVLSAHAMAGKTRASIDFQAGQTTLGPVDLAPAPRVY